MISVNSYSRANVQYRQKIYQPSFYSVNVVFVFTI